MSQKIELIALGTGAAFTMKGFQTNFVLRVNENESVHNLLIDCGSDIRFSLRGQGMSYLDIEAVTISHLHGDHASGVDYIAFPTYFDPRYKARYGKKPALFVERHLMRDLWDHSWRGSLEGLEGIDATLETYFDQNPIDKNGSFNFAGVKCDIVQSVHVQAKYSIVDSFGLMFTDPANGKRIYVTTDTQFAPSGMRAFYREADVIVHDCETMYRSNVHSHYDDLKTLDAETKSKIRLIHYQDNVLDAWDEWQKKAKDDGFFGFVKDGVIYSSEEA